MDGGAFLIAVAVGGLGLLALLGLGWWLERPLHDQVRAWVRQVCAGQRARDRRNSLRRKSADGVD